jgi:transposase InsO family protein
VVLLSHFEQSRKSPPTGQKSDSVTSSRVSTAGGTTSHTSADAPLTADPGRHSAPKIPPEAPPYHINPHLSEADTALVRRLLERNKKSFAGDAATVPTASPGVKHAIRLTDPKPFKQRAYRQSPKKQEFVRGKVQELLRKKLIVKSASPWSSPVVLVPKPHNPEELRMCIDYRKLNAQTKKDAYPIPLIEDCLEVCQAADWYTVLDIKDAYWHIEMEEESKQYTAFVTPDGLFQWNRMPFGLSNAPATFQRHVDHVLREHLGKYCTAFFDDCLVYSSGALTDHLVHVEIILKCLADAGLEVSLSKCHFAMQEVNYVGYVISKGTIKPDPALVRGIAAVQPPTNVKELRQFLGLVNYYRKFVKGFASIALPLYKLTKQSVEFVWSAVCQHAFATLTQALITAPCLKAPDYHLPFILQTDAAHEGIGAVLAQEHDGVEHPVAFISRKLKPAEINYSGTEKECLAVVWAIGQFEHYLIDAPFTVLTDHAALQWLPQKKFDNNRLMRWALKLQEFNFIVKHRAGTKNANADALSRAPIANSAPPEYDTHDPGVGLQDVAPKYVRLTARSRLPFPVIGFIPVDPSCAVFNASVAIIDESRLGQLAEAQRSENGTRQKIDWLEKQLVPATLTAVEKQRFTADCKNYILDPQPSPCPPVLKYAPAKPKRGLASFSPVLPRVVVPAIFRKELLELFHDAPFSGHLGIKRTIRRLSHNYYWNTLQQDVTDYVNACAVCASEKVRRRSPDLPAGSMPSPTLPFHVISVDHIGPLTKSDDFKYVLVIIDHFTRWCITVPVFDVSANSTARALYDEVYNKYGLPKILISDRGSAFHNDVVAMLHTQLRVRHLFTVPYHPQSNGVVERLNGTIKQILTALASTHGDQWVQVLQAATFAYNTSVSEVTGYTPHYLLFGREALVPGDQLAISAEAADLDLVSDLPHDNYASQLLQDLSECHSVVQAIFASKEQLRHDERYATARVPTYEVGDRVWVKDPRRIKKPKLYAPWIGPGVIRRKLSELVYLIDYPNARELGFRERSQTIHLNNMKPYTSPVPPADDSDGLQPPRVPLEAEDDADEKKSNDSPHPPAPPLPPTSPPEPPASPVPARDPVAPEAPAPPPTIPPVERTRPLPFPRTQRLPSELLDAPAKGNDAENARDIPTSDTVASSVAERRRSHQRPFYSDDFYARPLPVPAQIHHSRRPGISNPTRRTPPKASKGGV